MKTIKLLLIFTIISLFQMSTVKADYGPCDFDSHTPWDESTFRMELECGLTVNVAFYYRISEGYFRDIYIGDFKFEVAFGGNPTTYYRDARIDEIIDCLKYYEDLGYPNANTVAVLKHIVTSEFLINFMTPPGLDITAQSPAEKLLGPEWSLEHEEGCENIYRIGSSACMRAQWALDPTDLYIANGVDFGIIADNPGWQSPFLTAWEKEDHDDPLNIQQNWIMACNSQACCLETWRICIMMDEYGLKGYKFDILSRTLSNTYTQCDSNNLTNDQCQPICD